MSDEFDEAGQEPPQVPIVTLHPSLVCELSAQIVSLSVADYLALRGRLRGMAEQFERHLLPEISRVSDESAEGDPS